MKKILITVLVLFILLVGGVFAFISTFDLNRYRPMIVQKAGEALGAPVAIGKLSLVWRSGIAARIEGITVYADAQKSASSVKVKEVSALVKLMPLLHKNIEISSIIVQEPMVHLVKNAQGAVQINGVKLPSASSGPEKSPQPSGVPSIHIDLLKVRDAQVVFDDLTASPPTRISVKDVDVDVKDFSLDRPFEFDVRANLMGPKQNVRVGGEMTLPQEGKGGVIEDLELSTDLADWNLADLTKAVPSLASAGIQDLKGGLKLSLARLELDNVPAAKADLKLKDGRVKLDKVRGALDNLQLSASLGGGDLRVGNFSADFAGGTLKAKGVVKSFAKQPALGLTFVSRDLLLDQLLPPSAGDKRLSGKLSVDVEGQANGLAWPEISRTLNGQGKVELKEGILINTNLLKTVIDKLSMIPGADRLIRDNLPPPYRAKLNEPSTVLRPLVVPFTAQNGVVVFNNLDVQSEMVGLRGAGQLSLPDSMLSAQAAIQLEQGVSQMIIGAVPQIKLLANGAGQIEIPTRIEGPLSHPRILPDTEYLTQKLLASQLTSFVQNSEQSIQQVRNLLDKPTEAGQAGVKKSVQGLLGSEDSLKNLFKQAISGEEPAQDQQKQQPAASGTDIQVQ